MVDAMRGVPEQIGPFRIVRRLGAGGMAEAYEGVRSGPGGFQQRVCVKRVLPGYSTDSEFVRLFLREARLAASLSHRNVTRVVDFGEDGGCYFLALELVEGMDVRRLLKAIGSSPRLPMDVVALIGVEIAEALEHAHTRGQPGPIVHRDVSPANILVSVDGDVKLTDFGISKALNDAPATRTDFVRGNIWYMAPEQIEGGVNAPDPRSDLFSLGVVLYQCLAGHRPYHGPTDLAAMVALSTGQRMPLREAAPDTPEPMVTVIERLLAHRPEHRFQRASAVAEALAPLTQVASARRTLMQIVRGHRDVPTAPAQLEPQTIQLGERRNAQHDPAPTHHGGAPNIEAHPPTSPWARQANENDRHAQRPVAPSAPAAPMRSTAHGHAGAASNARAE